MVLGTTLGMAMVPTGGQVPSMLPSGLLELELELHRIIIDLLRHQQLRHDRLGKLCAERLLLHESADSFTGWTWQVMLNDAVDHELLQRAVGADGVEVLVNGLETDNGVFWKVPHDVGDDVVPDILDLDILCKGVQLEEVFQDLCIGAVLVCLEWWEIPRVEPGEEVLDDLKVIVVDMVGLGTCLDKLPIKECAEVGRSLTQ